MSSLLSILIYPSRLLKRRNASISSVVCNIAHRPPSRLLSTHFTGASERLRYDRDTGIIWETSPSQQKPLYQTIIGIEIHAQLSIPTKLFSSAPTRHNPAFNAVSPNTSVHPYDLAYPGTLPTLSLSAVKASILSAAALNCNIHKCSRFERKHYFYPDLPLGYQITQQRWPLASEGLVTFMPYYNKQVPPKKGKNKKRRRGGKSQEDKAQDSGDESNDAKTEFEPQPTQLRIERIQIEQDTGKTTTHNTANGHGQTITKSHIDYNRAGCALIEIVSYPDLRSAHEAAGVVEKIRKLMKHVGSCDGRMEEGSLRCDVNVSIAPISGSDVSHYSREELPPGTGHRVEVKNLNSLRQIIAATEYEALRQSLLAQTNTPTGRETRTFHVKSVSDIHPLGGETFCIRAKGDAIDYRFMPEPDLPPLILDAETLGCDLSLEEFVEKNAPESLEEAKARLLNEYGLAQDVVDVITGDPPAIALFEQTVETARKELVAVEDEGSDKSDLIPILAANWLCNDLFALVKKTAVKGARDTDEDDGTLNNPISVEYSTVDDKRLGALVAMVANGTLTTSMAKKVLTIMFEDDLHSFPNDIAESHGWRVISDMGTLVELCESIVLDSENESQLEQYKLGGKKIWKIEKFFVGKIMAASKGNAHPERMKEALACVLEKIKQ
ncbi:hypothetical protein ACHAXR_005205 [Thalassiosira sp. AJA248-18]